ncbi:MAG: aminopeptidase P family protein [Bacteroidota bacterium]
MTSKEKINSLRAKMASENLDAVLIPLTDPHQSEYIGAAWKALEWYSGFSGSAGNMIVTQHFAGLWTDSRYFLQAEDQLAESGIELMKLKKAHAPEHLKWMADNLPAENSVGFDFRLISIAQFKQMRTLFSDKGILIADTKIAFDAWSTRPPLSSEPIEDHPVKFAGKSRKEKLSKIRAQLKNKQSDYQLLSALDEIAWTFNLRGNDVKFNPVFLSYALIGHYESKLFVQKDKLSEDLIKTLEADGITVYPYKAVDIVLDDLPHEAKILVDPSSISAWLTQQVPLACELFKDMSIIRQLKSVKNEVEISHIRNVMVKDGVALVKLYMWLEKNLPSGMVTEVEVGKKLDAFRSQQEGYRGESFAAIAGYQGHGAIVHYRATPSTDVTLTPNGIFLLDSGGQYVDGTTDITRTIALGEPTKEEKKHYTLVLKGHIALATCVFPEGTKGFQLEAMARRPLWSAFRNYGHGTGHGVGFFLNVHEGPQSFGTGRTAHPASGLVPGMLTSNEPGYYETGVYGIRIENLILTVNAGESTYGNFLKFESVTLFPIDTSLIELSLLDHEEITWLNDYHSKVFELLSPRLDNAENEWLKSKTKPVFLA